ncbi:hypothetical protein Raf01_61950 [Rugosimonospora africana]|uniref:Uncharacterized protein n=1 Tax=Rugosimonospora africana TaxID=556532 RepID=A0A8J3QY69_9ACTN|nr:hypothetical protein Raf01_61950 [Rugosimonospora africana]
MPPEDEVTVQLNDVEPEAPVVSVAVTTTVDVPEVVGVPLIRPPVLMDSPEGRPVAVNRSVWPDAESDALICNDTPVPATVERDPGLMTVTVFPLPLPAE